MISRNLKLRKKKSKHGADHFKGEETEEGGVDVSDEV